MKYGRLLHYAPEPVALAPACYIQRPEEIKPTGLWVSVEGDDDWKSWCEGEEFRLEYMRVAHEVTLKPGNQVLHLSTAPEILRFTSEFETPLCPDVPAMRTTKTIDWRRVAKRWQGILIAPYCWRLRMDERTFWYYPWDCASGCIWDLDAIQSFAWLPVQTPNGESTSAAR